MTRTMTLISSRLTPLFAAGRVEDKAEMLSLRMDLLPPKRLMRLAQLEAFTVTLSPSQTTGELPSSSPSPLSPPQRDGGDHPLVDDVLANMAGGVAPSRDQVAEQVVSLLEAALVGRAQPGLRHLLRRLSPSPLECAAASKLKVAGCIGGEWDKVLSLEPSPCGGYVAASMVAYVPRPLTLISTIHSWPRFSLSLSARP